jgi:hypothetical protein
MGTLWSIGILKIIGFDPTSAKERDLSYVEGKIKFHQSKINLKLVVGNVFDLQNEFSIRFGGFKEKLWDKGSFFYNFGIIYLSTPKFSPRSVR